MAAAVAMAAPSANAAAQPNRFWFTFDTTKPRTPTDAALHILYRDPEDPQNPDGKAPPLTYVKIAAPPGTVFDPTAVPACHASDAELMLLGPPACPPASRVGQGFGSVVADPGPPDPFVADVALFNYGEGIVEVLTFPGDVRATDRAKFEGSSTLVLHPAVVPGISEREFSFIYHGRRRGSGKPFITTPPSCPRSGVWTSRLTYRVTTGATYHARSVTPCDRPASSRRHAIDASVSPRRVDQGDPVVLEVRVRSSDARCVAGALIRIPGHGETRTNDTGRAALATTFHRSGQRTLTASKRGCESGRATLTVLPEVDSADDDARR
jgi:hypothetical protein